MKKSDHRKREPDRRMLEKYYHSRGATSFDEGRFNQAIRFFRKALALDDQPYTRFHLSLAYVGRDDPDRALREVTEAIRLSPHTAEYYLHRSALWRRKGEAHLAEEDDRTAIRIDKNSGRAGEIRTAAQAVQAAFGWAAAEDRFDTSGVRSEELKVIAEEAFKSNERRREAVDNRSCVVACPAFCCHFIKEPVLHGVHFGPWKLRATRRFLAEEGLSEADHLGVLRINREEQRLNLVPPDVIVRKQGRSVVFYPKLKGRPLGKNRMKDLPAGRDFRRLSWITEKARACAFLDKGTCAIHDLGDEPALPACKEFLCLTGFVFLVLEHLGVVQKGETQHFDMARLNALAVEALLLLSYRLFANEDLTGLESEMHHAVRCAIEADARGDVRETTDRIEQYRRLEEEHKGEFSRQEEQLKRDVRRLLRDEVEPPRG